MAVICEKVIDYKAEKEEFIRELKKGDHDIDIFTNEEVDYQQCVNSDFLAFSEHLKSKGALKLINEAPKNEKKNINN